MFAFWIRLWLYETNIEQVCLSKVPHSATLPKTTQIGRLPVNSANLLRTAILWNISWWLLMRKDSWRKILIFTLKSLSLSATNMYISCFLQCMEFTILCYQFSKEINDCLLLWAFLFLVLWEEFWESSSKDRVITISLKINFFWHTVLYLRILEMFERWKGTLK